MITDQKTTGVPNGSAFSMSDQRQRTQFVKPNQSNNVGRTSSSGATPRGNAGLFARPQQQVQTKAPTAQESTPFTKLVTPVQTATSAPSQISQPTVEQDVTPTIEQEQPQAVAPAVAAPIETALDKARGAIKGLSNADITSLLDELANGSLKGID